MIKTVSFAPPRAASSRSTGKASPSPKKTSSRAASGSPSPQIEMEFSTPEALPAEVSAPVEVKAKPAKAEAPKAEAPKAEAPKAAPKVKAAKAVKVEPVAPEAAVALEAPKPIAIKTGADKPKGKRVYAPKDLAAQYGEKIVERVAVPIVETIAPKKRLNKNEREARRQLMKPDEGLLARLARATQITTKSPKSEPRGKGWKFVCGRCGTTSFFQTPGAVCVCGTIAVKELV